MQEDRSVRFPLGSRVQLEALSRDPYPVLKALQEQEPVSWVAESQAWFVTRRADCLAILLDSTTFSVASASSLLEDTLGQTMLSTDGVRQRQLRQPFNGPFAPREVRARMTAPITSYVHGLIDGFVASGQADLKSAFADRLVLWTVMTVLGLPIHDFPTVRDWFTDIAYALGNFTRDPAVRERGQAAASAFGAYAAMHLERLKREPDDSVLAAVACSGELSNEEILAAARVIVFGGVETDVFDLRRPNARDHLSFAIGKHFCLGAALARLEGEVGLRLLLERLQGLRLDAARPSSPQGHEFRSPPTLHVQWGSLEESDT